MAKPTHGPVPKLSDNRMRRLSGSLCSVATAMLIAVSPSLLIAQDPTRARPDTTKPAVDTQPTPPQPAPAPALPFEFSGILLQRLEMRVKPKLCN